MSKTCDYCKVVGEAYTFGSGETICSKCLTSLGTDARELRCRVYNLSIQNVALVEALEEIAALVMEYDVPAAWEARTITQIALAKAKG